MKLIPIAALAAIGAIAPAAAQGFAGLASWYGNGSGNRTASGARFDQDGLTCAHRSLPFGTRLRVRYAGRAVDVVVNDRGPFVRGRVLDLSLAAARALGLRAIGVGRVRAEILP